MEKFAAQVSQAAKSEISRPLRAKDFQQVARGYGTPASVGADRRWVQRRKVVLGGQLATHQSQVIKWGFVFSAMLDFRDGVCEFWSIHTVLASKIFLSLKLSALGMETSQRYFLKNSINIAGFWAEIRVRLSHVVVGLETIINHLLNCVSPSSKTFLLSKKL